MKSNSEVSFGLKTVTLEHWLKNEHTPEQSALQEQLYIAIQRGNKELIEENLMNFCISLLSLNEEDQVFVARTFFNSLILIIISSQSRRGQLQPHVLCKAYETIHEIEQWENISEYILKIPTYIDVLVDEIFASYPIIEDCGEHVEKALRIIHANLTNKQLSVNWLADQLDISTTHLANLFKLSIGMNISDYIAKQKVKAIEYELIHTTKTLAEIRERYGFVSHSHFIQFFKKHTGITPLKFKQAMLNINNNE